jgi:hypothetical protein
MYKTAWHTLPVQNGTIHPRGLGGYAHEVFTFNTDADRQAFIGAMIHDLGFTPEYATAQDTKHRDADKFVVAVRLPDEAKQ